MQPPTSACPHTARTLIQIKNKKTRRNKDTACWRPARGHPRTWMPYGVATWRSGDTPGWNPGLPLTLHLTGPLATDHWRTPVHPHTLWGTPATGSRYGTLRVPVTGEPARSWNTPCRLSIHLDYRSDPPSDLDPDPGTCGQPGHQRPSVPARPRTMTAGPPGPWGPAPWGLALGTRTGLESQDPGPCVPKQVQDSWTPSVYTAHTLMTRRPRDLDLAGRHRANLHWRPRSFPG
ncbi:unnamed protein product [Arctogadus glacialis]